MATLAPSFLIGSSPFLQVARTTIKAGISSNFNQIRLLTVDLVVLERLKKIPRDLLWENVVTTLVTSFLIGSSSFLQITRTTIKAWMSLNFCQILQLNTDLVALECKKDHFKLADKKEMHNTRVIQ